MKKNFSDLISRLDNFADKKKDIILTIHDRDTDEIYHKFIIKTDKTLSEYAKEQHFKKTPGNSYYLILSEHRYMKLSYI